MQTKFKRHQYVRILHSPDTEYVEYHNEDDPTFQEVPIVPNMHGRVNIILPNGKYHVEILDDKGNTIAYAPFNEEDLSPIPE